MKNVTVALVLITSALFFISCSKKDCVCVTTQTIDGVIQTSSSSSSSNDSGVPGPLGNIGASEDCDYGDSFYSSTNYQGQIEEDRTECELE